MSASLKIGLWVDYLRSGVQEWLGSALGPFQHSGGDEADFTTTGAVPSLKRSKSCAAGVETVIWDRTDDPIDFEFAVVNAEVIGFLVIYTDEETSSSDATAAGTHQHKYYLGVGCCKPQTLTTYQALTRATASDPSGYAQNPASLTVGRVYKLAFYVPGSTAGIVDFAAFT